jgi:hypothetical protein
MLISRVLDRIAKCNSVGVEFNVALAIAIIGNFKVGQIALNTQRVAGRRVEVVAHQLILMGSLTPELTGAGAEARRAPTQANKMAKPWPVLASALNAQLGRGA